MSPRSEKQPGLTPTLATGARLSLNAEHGAEPRHLRPIHGAHGGFSHTASLRSSAAWVWSTKPRTLSLADSSL